MTSNYWQWGPQCCPTCDEFLACFNTDLCLEVVISGWTECIDVNQTVSIAVGAGTLEDLLTGILNCFNSGFVPLRNSDGDVIGEVDLYIRRPTCDPVPIWWFYIGIAIYQNAPVGTTVAITELIDYGVYIYNPIQDNAAAMDAVHTLCAGGTVSRIGVRNTIFGPDVCGGVGSSITAKLVTTGGSCVGTPPTNPCDAYLHCSGLFLGPMSVQFDAFADCDYAETLPDVGAITGHRKWTILNYNGGLGTQWELLLGISAFTSCTGEVDSDNDLAYYLPLGREDTSDYSDPGILLDYIDPVFGFHRETWIWAITVVITCNHGTGKAKIKKVLLDIQTFSGLEDPGTWPPSNTGTAVSGCLILGMETPFTNDGNSATGCGVLGTMLNSFYYTGCNLDGTQDEQFVVNATV